MTSQPFTLTSRLSMAPTLSSIASTCLLCIGLVGCRATDGAGPVSVPELRTGSAYVLRSVAGTPPPAPLVEREDLTVVVLADTLWLHADGTGVQGIVVERVTDHTSGAAGETFAEERPFTWAVTDGRVEIALECRDVILRQCIAPPHYTGPITPGGLTLRSLLHDPNPLRYERIED
jgi:hypothetical protein